MPALLEVFRVVRLREPPRRELQRLVEAWTQRRAPHLTLRGAATRRLLHHLATFQRAEAFPGKAMRFVDGLAAGGFGGDARQPRALFPERRERPLRARHGAARGPHRRRAPGGGARDLRRAARARGGSGRGVRHRRSGARPLQGRPRRSRAPGRQPLLRRTDRRRQDRAGQAARPLHVRRGRANDPARHVRVHAARRRPAAARGRPRRPEPGREGPARAALADLARRDREGPRRGLRPAAPGVRRGASHRRVRAR